MSTHRRFRRCLTGAQWSAVILALWTLLLMAAFFS